MNLCKIHCFHRFYNSVQTVVDNSRDCGTLLSGIRSSLTNIRHRYPGNTYCLPFLPKQHLFVVVTYVTLTIIVCRRNPGCNKFVCHRLSDPFIKEIIMRYGSNPTHDAEV